MASRTTTDPIEILLEMGIDLDNLSEEEDYLSALKEAIATILYKTKGKGNEKSTILIDEVVKIRRSRKVSDTKFKAKKTKISAKKFLGPGPSIAIEKYAKGGPLATIPKNNFKPEEEEKKKARTKRETNKEQNLLVGIAKSVSNIVDILKEQYNLKKKFASYDRKQAENERRKLQESNLEKRFSGLKKVAEKVIAPVKSVLDRIFDFFLNILIGRFLIKFIDWFADPKNKEKVDSIIRFLVDFGPKLLAAYLLFGTRIGRFITRLSFALIKGAARLGMAAAKFAIGFARANPAAAAITAIVGSAAIGGIAQSLTPSNDPERAEKGKTQLDDTQAFGGTTGAPISADMLGFTGGGKVNGAKGTDKIPAMLTDGEFVMSKGAVEKYGVDTLEAMNAAGGGTNQPKIVDDTVYASVGGYIGNKNNLGKRGTPDPSKGSSNTPSGSGRVNILKMMEYFGRVARQVERMAGSGVGYAQNFAGEGINLLNRGIGYSGRVAGEASKLISPSLSTLQRLPGEAQKLAAPAMSKAQQIYGGVEQKVGSTIDSIRNFDFSGLKTLGSNIHGAATEAVPALLASTLGISRTDKSISQDMQRAILEAQKNAAKRGQKNVDYGDYVGGGLSAAGLTMGRIGNDEFKRDEKGRIIGIRQIYDTNRSARDAMRQAGESFEAFKKSGFKDMGSLGRAAYKPFEALLAKVQNRGMTMHDVNFDEKVLGFKPGKEVLNPTQKRMIAEQKNREALQNKRPWWDKMGLFGGATAEMQRQQKNKPFYGPGGDPSGSGQGQDQLAKRPPRGRRAKIAPTPTKVSTPGPPPAGGSNVTVVRAPAPNTSQNQDKGSGSEANAAPTGNGNKAKWNILGIPMPF